MRKPRKIISGSTYHVVARANRKEFILQENKIKILFLEVIKEAKRKYSFSLLNFCIMNNHIHFLIKPTHNSNLSRIMQWILSVFAQRFNRIMGYTGHVWYDRFKSIIINGLQELLHAFRYIAENPVRAGIVQNPLDYPFNGVSFLRNKEYFILEKPDISLINALPEILGES
ncbi:MAG: transposase [Spirochaetales bacterium]